MKLEIFQCPTCGAPAIGTLEIVTGLALLNLPSGLGDTDYAGETRIDWDNQRTVRDDTDRATLECESGHQWQSKLTS